MPSVFIRTRLTKGGSKRYRIEYKLGGRGSRARYAGSFTTKREALARKAWVAGELANMRVPNLRMLGEPLPTAPTFADAAERWRASRVDVSQGTRTLHRVALNRALPLLGALPVDEIESRHVVALVTALAAGGAGSARRSRRRSRT